MSTSQAQLNSACEKSNLSLLFNQKSETVTEFGGRALHSLCSLVQIDPPKGESIEATRIEELRIE